MELLSSAGLLSLLQVIAIDLVLAGDNAIVIGLAAAGVPAHQRQKAILIGIAAATVLRICFAAITVQLLNFTGLRLIGGLMLVWVCWNMWSELHHVKAITPLNNAGNTSSKEKTLVQAAIQIIIADISMSLDNVLAVAGAAADNLPVLVMGLVMSIALMGLAASYIANLLNKFRWISYIGLAVIVYVAITMLYHGFTEVFPYTNS